MATSLPILTPPNPGIRRFLALALILVCLGLGACNITPTAGLRPYVDARDGYRFLYPNGWTQVQTSGGPDVLFRDIINATENVSVMISTVDSGQRLEDLGTPGEVGYTLQQNAIAPPESGRSAELVDAYARPNGNQTYYVLEYAVTLPGQQRHDLVVVGVNRQKLYTLDISTTEDRWGRVQELFHRVVESFLAV